MHAGSFGEAKLVSIEANEGHGAEFRCVGDMEQISRATARVEGREGIWGGAKARAWAPRPGCRSSGAITPPIIRRGEAPMRRIGPSRKTSSPLPSELPQLWVPRPYNARFRHSPARLSASRAPSVILSDDHLRALNRAPRTSSRAVVI